MRTGSAHTCQPQRHRLAGWSTAASCCDTAHVVGEHRVRGSASVTRSSTRSLRRWQPSLSASRRWRCLCRPVLSHQHTGVSSAEASRPTLAGSNARPRASVLQVELRQLYLRGSRRGGQELSPLSVRARRLWRRCSSLRCCDFQAQACPADALLLLTAGWAGRQARAQGLWHGQPRAAGAPRIASRTCCSRTHAILAASSHTCSTARALLLSSDLWYFNLSSSSTPMWSLNA